MTQLSLTHEFFFHLNKNPLLHLGTKYILSISHDSEFGVASHDVYKNHGDKYYIHALDNPNDVLPGTYVCGVSTVLRVRFK